MEEAFATRTCVVQAASDSSFIPGFNAQGRHSSQENAHSEAEVNAELFPSKDRPEHEVDLDI